MTVLIRTLSTEISRNDKDRRLAVSRWEIVLQNANRRRGKLIAVANMKGGVGKSTTVVSVAEAMAADNLSSAVLVVDLDPQASASVCVAGDQLLYELIVQERTLEAFLEKKIVLKERLDLYPLVKDQISTLTHQGKTLDVSLLPCGPHLRIFERELIYELAERNMGMNAINGQIHKVFESDFGKLQEKYDYIFFDCAPGISPISEAAIRIADLVIVPTIPDILSVYGLNAFHGAVWKHTPGGLPEPKSSPYILITRLQATRQHKEMCETLARNSKRVGTHYKLMRSTVPQAAGLVDALVKNGHLTYTRKYSPDLIDKTLTPLVREIKELL